MTPVGTWKTWQLSRTRRSPPSPSVSRTPSSAGLLGLGRQLGPGHSLCFLGLGSAEGFNQADKAINTAVKSGR